MSLTSRPKASSSRTVDEAMSVGYVREVGRREENHGGDLGEDAAVDLGHRAFVFEVDGVTHAAHDGDGAVLACQLSRERVVCDALDALLRCV